MATTIVSGLLPGSSFRISCRSASHLNRRSEEARRSLTTSPPPTLGTRAFELSSTHHIQSEASLSRQSPLRTTPSAESLGNFDARKAVVPDLPIVTVVVPCFNQESFVADVIVSVKRQRLTAWECIVVDDASTDRSLQELWAAIDGDKPFRVVRHKLNSGPK